MLSVRNPKENCRVRRGGEGGVCDLSQACNRAGIVADEKLGEGQGLIGILTKGRVDRKEYTMQAIKTSLIFLENRKWFCK